MADPEQHEPLTRAELEEAVRDLRSRVEALERTPASRRGRAPRGAAELGLIGALTEMTEPPADAAAPSGTITYAGVATLGGDGLAWQMVHSVPELLELDGTALTRQLAAIASPVRIRILRELSGGPLQTHELQARLDEPSAGQLYHHLRELLATGLVIQPRRSVYEVPARVVIPVLTLLACAFDLATAAPGEPEAS